MKQKYTLTIADMEINVITDQSPETVEHIVGILDRKMRGIALKSKRCTKNEAALLCALDFCADKIKTKEENDSLADELEEAKENLEHISDKLELVKRNAERLEKDRDRLEEENSRLRSLIDTMRVKGISSDSDLTLGNRSKEENGEGKFDDNKTSAAEQDTAENHENDDKKKKNIGRSRVGSMFDLLTFTDI